MSHYGMDMAAAKGEIVCQGHADYCAEHGHAKHTVDGVDTGRCPRCGVRTIPASEEVPDNTEKFEALLDAERDVKHARTLEGFGIDAATRDRGRNDRIKAQAKLSAILNTFTLEELNAFNEYRKAQQS
jgi:hypothetical protein